jgi:hypothetical protein
LKPKKGDKEIIVLTKTHLGEHVEQQRPFW